MPIANQTVAARTRRNFVTHLMRRLTHLGSTGNMLMAALFGSGWNLFELATGAKMAVNGAQKQITATVAQWPDLTVAPHRFGGVEYRLGTREIGHIHGDTLVDIPFPTAVRNALVASGEVHPHHILPESGWISFYIRQQEDIEQAVMLLQKSFQLAQAQAARRRPQQEAQQKAYQQKAHDDH